MRSVGAIGIGTLAIFGWIAAAGAADGVHEISQSCAVQADCFAGDTAGFPVTTQGNRSYVLTSSLSIPGADTTAIELGGGSTLDLNGFSIVGPVVCSGAPPSCVGTGSGRGVSSTGPAATVRNGRSPGWEAPRSSARTARASSKPTAEAASSAMAVTAGRSPIAASASGITAVGALILDNAVGSNGSYGVNTGFANGDAPWRRNHLDNNNGGNANAQAAGAQLGTNICGTAVCP